RHVPGAVRRLRRPADRLGGICDAHEALARAARPRGRGSIGWRGGGPRMIAAPLRELVCRANRLLARPGLVHGTFGNVSGVDFDAGICVIKPSGVPYEELTAERMVPVSIETGAALEPALRPSSDTPTHLELYRAFRCGGIVHTHSESATILAQARTP